MVDAPERILVTLNALIARFTYMVSGEIGVDWRSGLRFTLSGKGNDYEAIRSAVAGLQLARTAIDVAEREKAELRAKLALSAPVYSRRQLETRAEDLSRQLAEARGRIDELHNEVVERDCQLAERDVELAQIAVHLEAVQKDIDAIDAIPPSSQSQRNIRLVNAFNRARAALSGSGDEWRLVPVEVLDRFPELNTSNYTHDDVDRLNAWGVEVVLAAAPAPAGGTE